MRHDCERHGHIWRCGQQACVVCHVAHSEHDLIIARRPDGSDVGWYRPVAEPDLSVLDA